MGIKLLSQVWEKDIRGPARDVLMVYCDYANDDGRVAWPTIETVAWKAGYSVRQTQRIVKQLRTDGVLKQVKAHIGQQEGVRYYVNLSVIPDKPARWTGDTAMSGVTNATGDTHMSPVGVTQLCRGTGDICVSPKPLLTTNITTNGDADAPQAPQPATFNVSGISIMATDVANSASLGSETPHPQRVDGATDFFARAVKTKTVETLIRAWRLPAHLEDMCIAFAQVFNTEAGTATATLTKRSRGQWSEGASELCELQATQVELVAARDHAAKAGYTIAHPKAAAKTIINLRQARKGKPLARPQPMQHQPATYRVIEVQDDD